MQMRSVTTFTRSIGRKVIPQVSLRPGNQLLQVSLSLSHSPSPSSLAPFPAACLHTSRPTTITNLHPPRIHLQTRAMSSDSIPDRYKLVFYVPHSHLESTKDAVFATGAGSFPGGQYIKCCFQMPGQGQFLPSGGANPTIGAVGTLEVVEEMKVEVMCLGRSIMLHAVEALKQAHPYEEVAYEVYKMENV